METIHTDSAYRALSSRESNRAKIKISPDQLTSLQEQRTLASSNVQQQMNDSDTKGACPFTLMMARFHDRWRILKMLTPWSTMGWCCCFRCWHCQLGYHNEGTK